MLGARSFHNSSDYVPVLLINKIYFHLGSLAVHHAQRHCPIDKLLQVIDSHTGLGHRTMPEKASFGATELFQHPQPILLMNDQMSRAART